MPVRFLDREERERHRTPWADEFDENGPYVYVVIGSHRAYLDWVGQRKMIPSPANRTTFRDENRNQYRWVGRIEQVRGMKVAGMFEMYDADPELVKTVQEYLQVTKPVPPDPYDRIDLEDVATVLRRADPERRRDFLKSLGEILRPYAAMAADYLENPVE